MRAAAAAAVLALMLALPASAQVAMEGRFVAARSCPATQSIKTGSNAGNATVLAGRSYKLLGRNKDEATHYWIEVPGAEPAQRWVETGCGTTSAAVAAEEAPVPPPPATRGVSTAQAEAPFFVLAISWQPAFCEGLPNKRECRTQTRGRFDASHFSLHGLWPQPARNAFCKVDPELVAASEDGRWRDLPEPELSSATWTALEAVMPGAQSLLHRHEWIKHGTCYPGGDAETYYRDSIRLVGEINGSPVQDYLAANIGRTVTAGDIREHFDTAFGAGAGERVRIACKDDGDRRLIVELTIGLRGDISDGTPLAELMAASRPTDAGCPAGVVDAAGLQ